MYIVFFQKQKITKKQMLMKKTDLTALIQKAKDEHASIDEGEPSYAILGNYINDAQNLLPELEEEAELNSSQKEVYKKLEAAINL